MGLRAGGGGAGGPTLGRGQGRWFLPLLGVCVMHAARHSPRQVWSLTAARGVQAPGWVCEGMSGCAGAGVQVSVQASGCECAPGPVSRCGKCVY